MSARFSFLGYGQERRLYDIKFKASDYVGGMQTVGMVWQPAIDEKSVFLSKQKEFYKLNSDDVQQIITGPVLIPDLKIARLNEAGDEYDIRFSKEVIFELAKQFFRDKLTDQTNLNHSKIPLEGNYVVESWFKTSQEDKSISLGLNPDLPLGTWFLSYYVEDKDLFLKMKNQEIPVGGFSIEAYLDKELVTQSKINIMSTEKNKNKKTFLERITQSIEKLWDDEFKIQEMKNGQSTTVTLADLNKQNQTSTQMSADANQTPANKGLEDGEYTLPDGKKFSVKGGITALIEVTADEQAQLSAQKKADEDKKENEKTEMSKITEQITELAKIISEMKTENTSLKKEVEKLGKRPGVDTVNTTPKPLSKEELSKMTTAQRIVYSISQE